MNLTHMEYFLTLAEEQSFSRAAEKLFISQPALTKALQTAENEIGMHLFVREKRRVYPTPAGDVYLKYAARVRRLRSQTLADIHSAHAPRVKAPRFGINRLLALGQYSRVIGSFSQGEANPIPDFFMMDSLIALEELKSGKLEVAVVLATGTDSLGEDVEARYLSSESLGIVVPDTPEYQDILAVGRRTGAVPVRMLDGLPAVKTVNMGNFQHMVTSYLSQYGVHPDYQYEYSNQYMSINVAENNQALCFCHKSLIKESLRDRSFALDPPLQYHHYVCTRRGEPLSNQAQNFLSHLLGQG